MPLQIKHANGLTMPIIICDSCLEQITDAEDGIYLFRLPDKTGAINDMFFTHNKCCDAFKNLEPESSWADTPLECLPIYLGDNLNLNPEKARKTANMLN